MINFGTKLPAGLNYEQFLTTHGTPDQRERWQRVHGQIELAASQRELLRSFRRDLKVVCLAGAWCGDCVEQCPIFDHFARETQHITLHFFDRDAHPDLAQELSICGGARVPSVLFLSEDDQPVGRYGDRTLTKYRQIAEMVTGAACATGIVVDQDLQRGVVQDWLNEFERAQLILRTSPRLRQRHGD